MIWKCCEDIERIANMVILYRVRTFDKLKEVLNMLHNEGAKWGGCDSLEDKQYMRLVWKEEGDKLVIKNDNGVVTHASINFYSNEYNWKGQMYMVVDDGLHSTQGGKNMNTLIENVNQWFVDRNLEKGDGLGQLQKLHEEVYELAEARIVNDFSAEVDAVGDITVVLIGYCLQRGLDFEHCLESAYNEIKDRTGKVVNGVYVKDE